MKATLLACALLSAVGCATVERTMYDRRTNVVEVIRFATNTVRVSDQVTTTNVVTLTNVVQRVELAPNAVVEAAIGAGGAAAGNLLGIGGVLSTVLLGLYHGYARRKNGQQAAVMAQIVETSREVLKSTSQGQQLEAKFRAWMIDHQQEAGVITAVAKVVDERVNNDAAKGAARTIIGTG